MSWFNRLSTANKIAFIGVLVAIITLIFTIFLNNTSNNYNYKNQEISGNKNSIIEKAESVSINYGEENNSSNSFDEKNSASMFCEPVLDSKIEIHPPTLDEFMLDESKVAMLSFMVKYVVLNKGKKNTSITEFRWIMGDLPNGTILYQRLRGPFNKSQFRNGGIIELPLNLAQGEASYVFADVLMPLEEKEAKLLYKEYDKLGATEGVIDFMLLHNYLMKSNIKFTGSAVTGNDEVIQCSKFWLDEVKQVHPVIELDKQEEDDSNKINFEYASYISIDSTGGITINSSASSIENMRSHLKMLASKRGVAVIFMKENTDLSEATFKDFSSMARYYNVPFTFSGTSNFSDVKKEFDKIKKK